MVNSFVSLMLWMMAAWCHRNCMLSWYMEMIILITLSRGSSTIYTVSGSSSSNNNILTVLERSCSVSTHNIAQIRWDIGCTNLWIWHHIIIHIILATLVCAIRIAWMVGMISWWWSNNSCGRIGINYWSCIILISLWKIIVTMISTCVTLPSVWCIILFSWLWAYAS